ncbi:MAG: hypothetical protein R3C18_23175 [Planctomycetaceae bacterium]
MSAPATDLIHAYLDDTLTAEQHVELANWIKASPEHAGQFAETILLHNRLRAEMLAGDLLENQHAVVANRRSSERMWVRRVIALSTAVCVTLVLGLIFWQSVSSPVLAASDELQRIIQASEAALDRTYVVTALDEDIDSEALPSTVRGAKPSVDGALLHVRGPNQYVLVRYFADGTEFITGSDGTTAWSVPPRGRVRVSSDPTRFRGAVPGQQHAIPFIDMRNSLRQLQESYELDLSLETTPEGWRRMNATRRATATGGPKQVTLWYDAQSGVIHRMLLERLPQARGGPRNVLLELTAERDLGPAYFEHTSHHDTNREVIEE